MGVRASVAWLGSGWRLVRQRLSNRGDTEHEQALIRLGMALVVLIYSWFAPSPPPSTPVWAPSVAQLAYTVGAIAVVHVAWIVAYPAVNYLRRAMWMWVDNAAIIAAMAIGGAPMAALYPLLLWTTLGNGFRYSPAHLIGSALISATLFGLLISLHPFWQQMGSFAVSLLLGLLFIPGYCFRLLRNLHDARRRAEASNRAKTRFLATMSHELRTPLHAILGMTELLRGTALDTDQRDMARTIHTAGHGLLNMIDDILDIARIEAGAVRESVERFDLDRALHEVRDLLGFDARAKGLAFHLHLDWRLPSEVIGPKRPLNQILVNLAANAIKFTDQGHVRIEARSGTGSTGQPILHLVVIDTGCGIPEAAQSRIFESFAQADETTTRRYGGTGLGLAIVKRLVQLERGSVDLTSTPDQGTRFDVRLPIQPLDDVLDPVGGLVAVHGIPTASQWRALESCGLDYRTAATFDTGFVSTAILDLWCRRPGDPVSVPRHGRDLIIWGDGTGIGDALMVIPEGEGAAALRRAARAALVVADEIDRVPHLRVGTNETSLDILVADDHRINRLVVERLLLQGGHRAVVVESGEAVLERLDETAFDVCVLDLNMPGMGGMATAEKLVQRADRPRLVALTADATTATRDACLAAGFDAFLTKPVDGERLLAAVATSGTPRRDGRASAVPNGVLEYSRLRSLRQLEAGDDFVAGLVESFILDGEGLIAELKAAAAHGDVERFRDAAHALRSAATHLGAKALFESCLTVKSLDEAELRERAATIGIALDDAFKLAARALREAAAEDEPEADIRLSAPSAWSPGSAPAAPSSADLAAAARAPALPKGP